MTQNSILQDNKSSHLRNSCDINATLKQNYKLLLTDKNRA